MIKQVIVIRRDLKMRRGKEIAQGAHASMMFMSERLQRFFRGDDVPLFSAVQEQWLKGSFAKVCVQVQSGEEFWEIAKRATLVGLEVHVVTDSGATEFHGEPTVTCLAIGPDEAEKIDPVTGHLPLY